MLEDILERLRGELLTRAPLDALPEPVWKRTSALNTWGTNAIEGNTLTWQATVEDPDVLITPWIPDMRTLRLNPNPKAFLIEDLPCEERDFEHIVTKERG